MWRPARWTRVLDIRGRTVTGHGAGFRSAPRAPPAPRVCGFPGSYSCIKAFSETGLTEDLKKIDVPTLMMHGDDDQIVPIADSALLSAKIVKNATLKVYKRAPHGLCTTHKDQVNAELPAFFQAVS